MPISHVFDHAQKGRAGRNLWSAQIIVTEPINLDQQGFLTILQECIKGL
jgi:hypothetical protein